MKKKLSLFLVALFALVAYAASTTWKVTADGATSIEAGTTLTDNDVLLAKTVYASNVVGGCTIGNEVFDNGFQVRVAAFPSGDDKTGTEQSGSTPVVITAKKDCDLTVYYRRQSTAQTENKGAYADNDGKDLIVYKQSDLSKLSGTLTIDHETDDGKYGWATKKVSLTAGETYTLCAKGTTIQFFGFTYETEDPQPAEASYYVVGTMNKWQASDEYKLATNEVAEGEYMTTLQLTAGDELKVIKVEGETTTWYPDGMDNDLKVEVSGEYDIYFRPDGQGGQDWYQGYIYLALKDEPQPQPEETSYTIKFKDAGVGNGDGTAAKTSIEDLIADGANYVKATTATKAYNGKEGYGVKLSSSSANGSMTLTLAQSVKPTKITFKASAWVNSQGVQDVSSISINGKDAQSLTTDLTEYTVNYDGETEVSEIAIAATKRAYITELTVTYVDEGGGDQPQTVYSVAGSSEALFGSVWDASNEKNDMVKGEDNIFRINYEDVELEAGDILFKVVKNHNWETAYPAENYEILVPNAGKYNLTVTFNPETSEVGAELTSDEPVETYKATFTTNLGWKPVYAYAYNYTPADEAEGVQEHFYEPVEWPGTPMTLNDETGVYEVAIESAEEPNLIIFNDGTEEGSQVGINQTPNWEFENGKAYDYSTQPFKVTFNTDKWENVWAYTWTGKTPTVEWPGVAMKGDKGVYTYEFEAIEAPDSIIFNNGIQAEVKEQTGNLPFVNGTTYTFSEEKATAWAGDPDVAIEETGIIIPAKAFAKDEVQAEKIIHIVAKEISTAAPAKGFNSDVAEFQASDILILKNDGSNAELVPQTAIEVVDDGYQFKADLAIVEEVTKNGLIVKPANDKKIGIEYVEVEKAKAPEPVAEDINITPEAGADIAEALATAKAAVAKVGNITINLTADANYTVSAPIVAPANVVINGNGATVDASALAGNFIEMAVVDAPTEWTEANVTVKELTVKGLKKALFYSACKNYFGDVTVDKCVVELAADATTFDYTKGSTAVNFTVTNSTFYAPAATTKSFYSSQSGQKTTEYNGEAVQTFTFTNNTMYNLASGKNFFTHRQANQKWMAYNVKNNIFVNCGKSGQTIKGMNGGQGGPNPTWTIIGNAFNFDGADTSAAESTGDTDHTGDETPGLNETVQNSVAGVVTFTDAAAGNFNGVITVENVVATVPGDPRWTLTQKINPVDVVVEAADITDGDITAAIAAKAAGKPINNLTVNLAEGAYTVSAAMKAGGNIAINGNGATVDASALAGNFIEMAVVENPTEWTEANVTVKELTVKGLKKALFYSACKNYFGDVTVDKCVVELAADATTFDYTKGSTAVNFTVTNSTFYAPAATTKSFYSSQSGQKTTEYNGEAVQTFTFTNNTMYNLASGKNFFTHRQANQKWMAYNVKNNIFVNCGKSGQTIKGMNGGQGGPNPTWTIIGNAFNFDGADTSAAESTGDTDHTGDETPGLNETVQNSVAGVVAFTDAANGDFNGNFKLAPEATAPAALGAPKWTINFSENKFYIIGGPKEWKLDDMTEMTFNATTQAYEFEYAPTATAYFAFADKQFTAEEAAAEGAWNVFNSTNRYSLGRASDTDPNVEVSPSDEAKALVKGVEGTIALKAGTYKISVAKDFSTVTITGEVYEPIYTVAGAFVVGEDNQASFFGTAWDPTAAANDMEKQEDGTYKKVYENVSFTEIGQIQFKIVEDHSWAVNYGWDGYNAFFDVTAPATNVTVTFTFDPNGATDQDKVKIDVKSASTGINGIDAEDADDNTPIYNLSGQKVTKSYKGVVIKNGKKYMQK